MLQRALSYGGAGEFLSVDRAAAVAPPFLLGAPGDLSVAGRRCLFRPEYDPSTNLPKFRWRSPHKTQLHLYCMCFIV